MNSEEKKKRTERGIFKRSPVADGWNLNPVPIKSPRLTPIINLLLVLVLALVLASASALASALAPALASGCQTTTSN